MSKYVSAAELCSRLPFTERWLTKHAQAGDIPGAFQPGGEGTKWAFDEARFWNWWSGHEKRGHAWHPSINPETPDFTTDAYNATVGTDASLLEQAIEKWRYDDLTNGSRS